MFLSAYVREIHDVIGEFCRGGCRGNDGRRFRTSFENADEMIEALCPDDPHAGYKRRLRRVHCRYDECFDSLLSAGDGRRKHARDMAQTSVQRELAEHRRGSQCVFWEDDEFMHHHESQCDG